MTHAIFDAVYGNQRAPARRPWRRAAMLALVAHAGIIAWAGLAEPSLEVWAAAVALDLHNAMGREEVVTLETPPPARLPEKRQPVQQFVRKAATAVHKSIALPTAQAAKVITQDDAPVDLADNTFVTGNATRYAGGSTAATGIKVVPSIPGPDNSESVRLEATEWSCPWPKEADREQIDQQSVVIKVEVDIDGSVRQSKLVKDAGLGFGAAALQCAKRTRFQPARDPTGAPVRSWSPAIEVTFQR